MIMIPYIVVIVGTQTTSLTAGTASILKAVYKTVTAGTDR
jgi:hypothetical protein